MITIPVPDVLDQAAQVMLLHSRFEWPDLGRHPVDRGNKPNCGSSIDGVASFLSADVIKCDTVTFVEPNALPVREEIRLRANAQKCKRREYNAL
jgi:hypothetical protein